MISLPKRAVLLTSFVILSAALAILGPICTSGPWCGYVFGPTTMLLVLGLALTAPQSENLRLRWAIIAGLGCSMLGDILLMLPQDLFLPGLLAFLAAHVCYLVAFTADCRIPARIAPLLFWGVFGVIIVSILWPHVPSGLRLPVAIYTTVILVMAAQANGRAIRLRTKSALVLAIGATLFVLSDTLLALNRFGYRLPASRVLVLTPYFAAQLVIALSLSVRSTDTHE